MDRMQKFMRRLSPKMYAVVRRAYVAILENKLDQLDVTPMQGTKNCFRCRIGDVRIVFVRMQPGVNIIVEIQYRDKAYRNL